MAVNPPQPGVRHPRMGMRTVLTVLGPALAFAITTVDPVLLTLNLPEISRGLHVPPAQVGLLGSAATLVVAAAVLAVGNLGDSYGLKRLLIYGLAATIVFQLLAALSPNHWFLLAMRFADGFALTALLGLSLALLTVSVPDEFRPTAIGIFLASQATLYGISPLLGGWVVGAAGWRWLFVITPPLALVALLLTARYVPDPPRRPARPVDVTGVCLFGLALLSLVYGISAAQNGFASPRTWVPLVIAAVGFATFLWHERRARHPALDLSLFTRSDFVAATLAVLTFNFLVAGLGVILGRFGGLILGLPPRAVGLLYLPGTVLLAVTSVLTGRMVLRHGARRVLLTGLLVMIAGGLVVAFGASPVMALWLLILATWLINLGSFVTATPASDTILARATPADAGAVAAVQPTFGMTGYALGPTIYILLLNLFFHREWVADARTAGESVQQAQSGVDAVRSSLATSPGTPKFDPNLVQQRTGLALDLDYTNGVRLTMLVVTLLPVAVAILVFFAMPRRRRTRK
ncbi:MFS transporter [Amycolatopsis cynarae]|uniref:MFS transporter n=1 Tax=Amycolatopsis cynarae TaxID=2995223 RepID=A0ABY7ATZ0_9PSEU|nr:MFS transporter [Amycolatopsis sp. HUAS 11-8]WAL63420.1 MFS transporter [Amycolatopsis sp. HUAS 11-8]